VIIGQSSGVVYDNHKQMFPARVDLTGKLGRETVYIYIGLPE